MLLLGDAAHPMSPVRAQGISLAFRDAIIAANHLASVGLGGDTAALDAAVPCVEAERKPEIVRAQKLQRREAQGQATPGREAGDSLSLNGAPGSWAGTGGPNGRGSPDSATSGSAHNRFASTCPHAQPKRKSECGPQPEAAYRLRATRRHSSRRSAFAPLENARTHDATKQAAGR